METSSQTMYAHLSFVLKMLMSTCHIEILSYMYVVIIRPLVCANGPSVHWSLLLFILSTTTTTTTTTNNNNDNNHHHHHHHHHKSAYS